MGKAILVIHMPKSCYECRFHEVDDDFTVEEVDVCNAYCDVILEDEMKNKPSWCPLKPMPKGEWIRDFDGNEFYWYCSSCKENYYEEDLYLGGNEFPNFCPNCGADMRGRKE